MNTPAPRPVGSDRIADELMNIVKPWQTEPAGPVVVIAHIDDNGKPSTWVLPVVFDRDASPIAMGPESMFATHRPTPISKHEPRTPAANGRAECLWHPDMRRNGYPVTLAAVEELAVSKARASWEASQ